MGAARRAERPLIGVTTSEVRVGGSSVPLAQSDPPRTDMALGLSYLHAIEQAGGLPVVLPPLEGEAVAPLLDRLDGLCLSGGPDIDPEHYGARAHPELGPTEREVDRFEIAAARAADERELPVLAICRGTQALNVSRGGTLHQHVPERFGLEIEHRQDVPGEQVVHDVRIDPDSHLARTMGTSETRVNSFHHQAIDRLGDELRIVAHAPDGVVEGVEGEGPRYLLAVQWHAESLTARPEQAALFAGLVQAAAARGERRETEPASAP